MQITNLPFSHVCLNSGNGALGDYSRGKEFLSVRERNKDCIQLWKKCKFQAQKIFIAIYKVF